MSTKSEIVRSPIAGGFTEAALDAFLHSRDDPAWLIERRRQAFARFQSFPLPSARDEEWRRTDIRGLRLDTFTPRFAEAPGQEEVAAFDDIWESLSKHYATGIEHINGASVRHPDLSRHGGAIFIDLDRAVKECPEILNRYLLTEAVTAADDFFAALHAAFWAGGTLLYVPKGVKIEAPLFSLIGLAGGGRVDLSHTL
ncbi:MAG TPA: Fe-S cluster assembly protein SufD, partial [Isosphaeraceae bacterium]|nr:Fe-S cluster assembly protein SufD [Isosphaeraceae bacterium]